jgi:hypothetical protein
MAPIARESGAGTGDVVIPIAPTDPALTPGARYSGLGISRGASSCCRDCNCAHRSAQMEECVAVGLRKTPGGRRDSAEATGPGGRTRAPAGPLSETRTMRCLRPRRPPRLGCLGLKEKRVSRVRASRRRDHLPRRLRQARAHKRVNGCGEHRPWRARRSLLLERPIRALSKKRDMQRNTAVARDSGAANDQNCTIPI